jgi:hypothetical protein
MGGRYLVSGADLGMLAGFAKSGFCDKVEETVHQIVDDNYIEDSNDSIENDIKTLRGFFEPMETMLIDCLRTCPKCEGEDLTIDYRVKGEKKYKTDVSQFLKEEPIWDISETKQFYTLNKNILKIHCHTCQYEWWEVPHDER